HSQVYKTKEYSQFKLDSEYNRDVNANHVKKIKESLKKFGDFGECFPIVVDETGRIVDGQHRFSARKELGLTIYYIQSTELDSTKLGGINDAIAKWKPESFIKVAKNNPYVKWITEEIIPYIPRKIKPFGRLAKRLDVSKQVLLTGTSEDRKYNLLVARTPLFIKYANILENKMTDFNDVTTSVDYLLLFALKLTKFGVHEDLIISGTYNEIMSDLYSKNLIK
ncbi:MAG: ParB N-terminal domain-containing protein, partial [Bacteroidales bacterium]